MSLPQINLVVIGHKDHGKSTLIGRLLYDSKAIPEQKLKDIMIESDVSDIQELEFAHILDSLEEERRGGLTIDIVQIPFKSEAYQYTIIDCPGHREFIKKMLTGASQADAALLVVSVAEGIEDQTRQHLFLAKTLGISHLVVVVNKMDLAGYSQDRFKTISSRLRRICSELGYQEPPFVPISAFRGDNITTKSEKMNWYNGKTLIETLDRTAMPSKAPVEKPLRALVQDVYRAMERQIIVCKVETGQLRTGDNVLVMPSKKIGHVNKIESFGSKSDVSSAGESVGLIIDNLNTVQRGDVLCSPDEPVRLIKRFEAEIIVFSKLELKKGKSVTIRTGTTERECKVEKISEKIDSINLGVLECNSTSISNGEVGKVILKPVEPICLELYSHIPHLGRLIIVGNKGPAAAGIVLEVEDFESNE